VDRAVLGRVHEFHGTRLLVSQKSAKSKSVSLTNSHINDSCRSPVQHAWETTSHFTQVNGTTNMASTPTIEAGALLDAIALATQYWPIVALLVLAEIIVTRRNRKSESRLNERIQTLELEIDTALVPLNRDGIG
jgi:hypothetical protein